MIEGLKYEYAPRTAVIAAYSKAPNHLNQQNAHHFREHTISCRCHHLRQHLFGRVGFPGEPLNRSASTIPRLYYMRLHTGAIPVQPRKKRSEAGYTSREGSLLR